MSQVRSRSTSGAGRIAVIGCGLSGATCARSLAERGYLVELFDKGRGPGGRLSSRHTDRGAVDHGAPAFTASSAAFLQAVGEWRRKAVVAPWHPSAARVRDGRPKSTELPEMYVGLPHMSELVRHELGEVPIHSSTRVELVSRTAGTWTVVDASGNDYGPFRELVVALPAPQAVALPGIPESISQPLRAVELEPVWVSMVQIVEPDVSPFDVLIFDDGPLDRAVRSGSKPSRSEDGWWTLAARSTWSRSHLDDDAQSVIRDLMGAFASAVSGRCPEIQQAIAHRWRYARVVDPLTKTVVRAPQLGITACGDFAGWHDGVEAAWISGRDAARKIAADTCATGEDGSTF